MLTVKKAIELLSTYPQDSELKWCTGAEIKHISAVDDMVIISDKKPLGECNRCNNNVFFEESSEYSAYCPTCDESLYKMEYTPLH